MRGILTLEQELRATRLAGGQKNAKKPDQAPLPTESERPWQRDVDQLQQTMREVIRVVAGLSGVELPGLPPGLLDDAAPAPRLDIKTLKDRFRNELEGFSLKTTQELTRQAREQTRSALEAVQNEIAGRIDQIAAEFRENSQLPAQIEKLLEPCIEDAEARLQKSVSQKFEQLIAEQERMVQDKLQAALSSFQSQLSSLEQAVQQVRAKADSVAKPAEPSTAKVEELFAKQERLVQDKLQAAIGSFQSQLSSLEQTVQQVRAKADSVARPAEPSTAKVEELLAKQERLVQDKLQAAIGSFQSQLSSLEQTVQQVRAKADSAAKPAEPPTAKVEELFAKQERMVQDKLQAALGSFQSQLSSLEQTVQNIRAKSDLAAHLPAQPSTSQIEGLLAKQERSVDAKLQAAIGSVQAQIGSLEQTVQQVRAKADSVAKPAEPSTAKVEELFAKQERLVQDKLQGVLSAVQSQIGLLTQAVQQIREKAGSPAQPLSAALGKVPQRDENGLNNGIKDFLDQSFSRIESSITNLRDIPRTQPAPSSTAELEWLRKAIPSGSTDMLLRVQQAMDNLDRLGPKDALPVT